MASERPQNKNLKPLGSGAMTPEEEREIHRKGAIAANKARARNADIRAAVRAVANLNLNGRARSVDIEKMKSVEELKEPGAPMISQLVFSQFQCAANGDKESRDWICRMLGISAVQMEDQPGVSVTVDANAGTDLDGGVRIHLIRGTRSEADPMTVNTDTQDESGTGEA